jgi:hypothetical protein
MRKDPKFFGIVSKLAELPAEQYDSLTTIISALGKKKLVNEVEYINVITIRKLLYYF